MIVLEPKEDLAVKVLKRLYGDDATLLKLDTLINNVGGEGSKMINQFATKVKCNNLREKTENDAIIDWFINEYLPGSNGGGGRNISSKTFEASSGVRNQISKLISNGYLNKVLNPPSTEEAEKDGEVINCLDFDKILADGEVCALCSAQGALRDLGRFLGFFLILQLQSAVFRRPGNEYTRRECILYIDEFQVYANSGMQDMLTQGRSYRVGCVLATQNRALIGMNSGNKSRSFTDLVSTNARNVVIFPGANAEDAQYYSKEFGEEKVMKENISVSRDKYRASLFNEKETVRVDEKYEARYRPTDIIYQSFGKALVRTIKDASVQKPQLIKLEFIPKDVNDNTTLFIDEYNKQQLINETDIDAEKAQETSFFTINDDYNSNSDMKEYPDIEMPSVDSFEFNITDEEIEGVMDIM